MQEFPEKIEIFAREDEKIKLAYIEATRLLGFGARNHPGVLSPPGASE